MNRGSPTRLSEVKVGTFVIVSSIILALAIFNIGTRVGLLEKTFRAKTYLNNTSGLKPSDIVLIGGVEAGNVSQIKISKPGEMPPTDSNQKNLERIRELENLGGQLVEKIPSNEKKLRKIRSEYETVLGKYGRRSPQAKALEGELDDLESLLDDQREDLNNLDRSIEEIRNRLQNIEVYLDIKEDHRVWIRRDSNISMGSVGLLGDRYVEVSLGRAVEPALTTTEQFETLFGIETEEVVIITGSSEAGFRELIVGANDVLANVQVLSKKLEDIMAGLGEGRGSVGKFLTDPAFFKTVNQTMIGAQHTIERTADLMKRLSEGTGTVPSLIRERDVYDNIRSSTAHFQNITKSIDEGEGTFGKFVTDSSFYDKSNHLISNIEGITRRMDEGQGTLGKLSTDEQLYVDMRRALDQMTQLLKGIDDGRGTLGRLAKDEALYQNLNQVSSELVKLIYDFRQDPKKFLTIRFKLF